MTPRAAPQVRRPTAGRWDRLAHARGTAVTAVWASAVLTAVSAPSLVTGPEHRHLPLAALTSWVWAAAATGFLSRTGRSRMAMRTVATVVYAWAAAGLLAATAPPVVTGTAPTVIPVTPVAAPAVACLVTGYAVLAALAPARTHVRKPASS